MKKNSLQKMKKVILSGGVLLTGLLTFGFSEKASAHGYV
ncbi:chitin-binding protein, partial [Bacillus thuringiensis]|nr:chitin-binding protein [Bacillus thuringiensis]